MNASDHSAAPSAEATNSATPVVSGTAKPVDTPDKDPLTDILGQERILEVLKSKWQLGSVRDVQYRLESWLRDNPNPNDQERSGKRRPATAGDARLTAVNLKRRWESVTLVTKDINDGVDLWWLEGTSDRVRRGDGADV